MQVLIADLNREDVTPDEIATMLSCSAKFLDLDSLDAVELAVVAEKHFGIEIKVMGEGRPPLQSISTLAAPMNFVG